MSSKYQRLAISEDAILKTYAEWVNFMSIQDGRYKYIFHVPNETRCSWSVAKAVKAKGASKGVPDILCLYPTNKRPGFALEFKSAKGKASHEQLSWLGRLSVMGWHTMIVRSFDEAKAFTENYFGAK